MGWDGRPPGLLPCFGARLTGAKRRRARAAGEPARVPWPAAATCARVLACLFGRRRLIFAQSFDVMDRRLVRHLAPLITLFAVLEAAVGVV